jgi:glycerophosphoryl diester phosphodiesterase
MHYLQLRVKYKFQDEKYQVINGLLIIAASILTCLTFNIYANETNMNNKIVIAHRGASAYLPEHTLASKSLAYRMGADYIEQDVVLSKDNIPIVLHDIQLESVTNVRDIFPDRTREDGKYYALDFYLHELKSLTISERKNRIGKARAMNRYPADSSEFRIPTLEEEIQLIQTLNKSSGNTVGLYTEIKSPAWHTSQGYDLSSTVLATLAKYGYNQESDNIFIQCFDPEELVRIRTELKSKLKIVQLIGNNSFSGAGLNYKNMRTPEGLKQIAGYANGIGPPIDHLLETSFNKVKISNLVKDAHQFGLVVHTYTLKNDDLPHYVSDFNELMNYLFILADVDGVFTDFPDLAAQFKKQNLP